MRLPLSWRYAPYRRDHPSPESTYDECVSTVAIVSVERTIMVENLLLALDRQTDPVAESDWAVNRLM